MGTGRTSARRASLFNEHHGLRLEIPPSTWPSILVWSPLLPQKGMGLTRGVISTKAPSTLAQQRQWANSGLEQPQATL